MKSHSAKEGRSVKKPLLFSLLLLALVIAAVLIIDGRHVEINLSGDTEVVLEYGEKFSDPGAVAALTGRIFGTGAPLDVSVSGTVDPETLGTTEITYSATYLCFTGKAVRSVTIQDTTAPVISLTDVPGKNDFTAEDNFDGDVTPKVQRTEEADRIIYTVTDSSGNSAAEERLLAPVLALSGGESVEVTADYRFIDPGYSAKDCYDRDLTDRVVVEGLEEIIPWKVGSYDLTYSVSDDFGNSVSAKRHVEIVAAELPETVVQDKVIYLTFDDGPAESTGALLDLLAEYDAKATFFVTATDKNNSDMIGRAYREGHSIGVHAYKHAANVIYISEEAYFENFAKMEDLIYEQTGEYTRLVRFVGGSSNTSSMKVGEAGIMTKLAEDLTTMGYRYYDWNIQPENDECDAMRAFNNIVGQVPSLDTPIILQHDTAEWNITVVKLLLEWGTKHGYTFEGIDLTTPEVHHRIAN